MSPEQIIATTIALGALIALSLELLPIDQVGLLALVAVVVTGLVAPQEALSGFGNPAVITVGSLLVVAEGLHRTGALAWIAHRLLHLSSGRPMLFLVLLCVVVGVASAFVNNTPIVAVFVPLVLGISRDLRLPPSKLLIPLSYASILGGMCTLLGTSTNVLISGIMDSRGLEPIGMFEILPVGSVLFLAGLLYLFLVGRHLLPSRPSLAYNVGDSTMREFVTEVAVKAGSSAVGSPVGELVTRLKARLLLLVRGEEMLWNPGAEEPLRAGDILLVKGSVNSIAEVESLPGVELLPEIMEGKVTFDPRKMSFVELLVPPGSVAVGRRVKDLRLRRRTGLVVVALMRRGRHLREKIAQLTVLPGDILLAFGDERSIAEVRSQDDFSVLEGVQEHVRHRRKAPLALAILAGMVAGIVSGQVHIAVAALGAALAMVLAGCLGANQAYRAVNWRILFLLVGALALGRALENSKVAMDFSAFMVGAVGAENHLLALAAVYLTTSVLTELLTNGAVAVLMTPVAFSVGATLGLDPRTFVMAVLFASSVSFITPVGYQTNTLIYGVGGYKYRDFLVVGLPLQLICFILAMWLLPLVWPFQ